MYAKTRVTNPRARRRTTRRRRAAPRRRTTRRTTARRRPTRRRTYRRRAAPRRRTTTARRRTYRRRNPSRRRSRKIKVGEVLGIGVSVIAGVLGGGLLTAYVSPYVSRVGRGTPAAIANFGVGAGLITLGVLGSRKYRKYSTPLVVFAAAASVPWFINGLQELGVLGGAAASQQPAQQPPQQQAAGMGLAPGQIPGAPQMGAGFARGPIPGAVPYITRQAA